MKIGYQGEKGAYSEQAVKMRFGSDDALEAVSYATFAEVFEAVSLGTVEKGVVPIENFIAGSINQTYDLLLDHDLFIVGEIFLPIEHCLIGKKGSEVKKVYSHPQALAQCEEFIRNKGYEPRAASDTAGSVKIVKERGRDDEAAIASESAAEIYGLDVLEKGISTVKNNVTRFIVISKKECDKLEGDVKSSLVFAARHIPAALYKCLGGFATNTVNLEKLESRPIRGEHGNYLFYLDFAGGKDDVDVREALAELDFFTESVKFLGSYPKGK